MLAAAGAVFLMTQIKLHLKARPREPLTAKSVFAGLRYIAEKKSSWVPFRWTCFAVLLGGAVALLPVFASEVLALDPGVWASYARLRPSARAAWRCSWRTDRSAAVQA